MPELNFAVECAVPVRSAPALGFRVLVCELTSEPTPITSVALRGQVRIQPARRRYSGPEQEKLLDLFGTPDRWGKTVRELLWANIGVTVPAFAGETVVTLPVPCDRDPAHAAARYCDALDGGEVPLLFLFSGTVFYEAAGGRSQVAPIPWDREARYRLPVAVWKELFAEAATP